MIKHVIAGIAAAGIAVTAYALPAQAGTRPVDWTQRTCSALTAWDKHPTAGNLDKLVVASLHLQRGYLQGDVLELAADALTAKPDAKFVAVADQYAEEDCYGGA